MNIWDESDGNSPVLGEIGDLKSSLKSYFSIYKELVICYRNKKVLRNMLGLRECYWLKFLLLSLDTKRVIITWNCPLVSEFFFFRSVM